MKRKLTTTITVLAVILSCIPAMAQGNAKKLPLVDVAINKPVYASSELSYYEIEEVKDENGNPVIKENGEPEVTKTYVGANANYVVDNEDDGYVTCWQPAEDAAPLQTYVIVDLTHKYPISRIELDITCKRNFSISLTNDINDNSSWLKVYQQGNTAFEGDILTVYPQVGKSYRFVRVKREFGPGMADDIAISSLRVYAPAETGFKQIATGKTANANTNGQNWSKAANVTDGNYNSMVFADRGAFAPYITIDLGEETDVRRVELMQAMKDTSYFNLGILPHGKEMREGANSARYSIYLSDEDTTPDVFTANGEKVAQYEKTGNWGVAHSVTAFDVKASKPYRYVHIYTEEVNTLIVAEIFVYSKEETAAEEAAAKENIFAGAGCAAQSGSGEAAYINDGDEGTQWVMETADDFATFTLPGTFNIEDIEIITDSAPGSIEIWGGKSEDFASDTAKVKLFADETLSSAVTTGYAADYITVKPGADAQLPVSVKELALYAEEGFRLISVAAEASDAGINDGKLETVNIEAPEISVSTNSELEAVEIYFGDLPQGRRNVTLYGGTSKSNMTAIAGMGVNSASSEIPYTVILKGEQKNYKYFSLQNDAGAIRGGVNVNGKYSFTETKAAVSVKEITVYTKKENTPPPVSALEVVSAEAVDSEGNAAAAIGVKTGAKVMLKNGGEAVNAVVICAAVDADNIILSSKAESLELTAGEEKEVTVYAENIPPEATGFKVFVWQGLGTNQIPHTIHKTLIQGGN